MKNFYIYEKRAQMLMNNEQEKQRNERLTTLERAILILDYLMEAKEKPNFSPRSLRPLIFQTEQPLTSSKH